MLAGKVREVDSPVLSPDSAEHFIPLRKVQLLRFLEDRVPRDDQERFHAFARLVEATIHHEYHARLERLKEHYAPFDPDAATLPEEQTDELRSGKPLFDEITALLQRANYYALSNEEIKQALGTSTDWGLRLNVDLDAFEHLHISARGQEIDRRTRRRWQSWFRKEEVDVPLLQRLVVVFQLRQPVELHKQIEEEKIYIKMFKNIPHPDVDMLLPATHFNMTLFDRCKIVLPTLSGIVMAVVKVVQGTVLLVATGIYGILALLGFVGGTIGYGVKSFLGYLRTKEKYQLNLTQNLYYQNLDNNAGVLFRLLDEAEAQEFREALIAYTLLWIQAPGTAWTVEELDQHAETFLEEILGFRVDFEVNDALDKLVRWGCVEQRNDRYSATPIEQALAGMDRAWDSIFEYADSLE